MLVKRENILFLLKWVQYFLVSEWIMHCFYYHNAKDPQLHHRYVCENRNV